MNPAAIKALLQAKGWQHTVLITDCLGCGGMPEGSYTSGGMDVIMPGRDADFVVFDHELTLVETYVGGQSVGNAFTD